MIKCMMPWNADKHLSEIDLPQFPLIHLVNNRTLHATLTQYMYIAFILYKEHTDHYAILMKFRSTALAVAYYQMDVLWKAFPKPATPFMSSTWCTSKYKFHYLVMFEYQLSLQSGEMKMEYLHVQLISLTVYLTNRGNYKHNIIWFSDSWIRLQTPTIIVNVLGPHTVISVFTLPKCM